MNTRPLVGMILGETFGIMLYREQAVHTIKTLSGIPHNRALDILESIIKKGIIAEHKKNFIKGCSSKSGMNRKNALGIWDMILYCQMSSKAYYAQKAILTYKMAYLMAN